MHDVAPLTPLRYARDAWPDVVAPPYDVVDAELRARLAARHPHNVVHIDLPEGEGDARYLRARDLFEQWQATGVLVRERTPAYWRYRQTFEPPGGGARVTRAGFLALVRAQPYSARRVLPHERTLRGPKADRMALSRATRAVLSPQFMLYSDPAGRLDAVLDGGEPIGAFTTDDGIAHELARIEGERAFAEIRAVLGERPLLIADGHHRYETAVSLAAEIDAEARARGVPHTERGEHHYTFALLANGDDPNLVVFATHRLVHSLPAFDLAALVEGARVLFEVSEIRGLDATERALEAAKRPAVAAVDRGGRGLLFTLRPDADLAAHPVLGKRPQCLRETGVALLHDAILEGLLGIDAEAQAAKTNLRYVQDPRVGAAAVDGGSAQLLLLLRPTEVATVRRVAEAGEVMPQKSTFFYPKVPSGLLFHTLLPEREVT